jgi:hypothetical protein
MKQHVAERKVFFLKEEPKTFFSMNESSLLLFFKKEALAFLSPESSSDEGRRR